MSKDVSMMQGQSVLSPSSNVARSDGAPTNIVTDEFGVLWTRDAGGAAPISGPGTAGQPLQFFDTPAAATAPDADTPAAGGTLRNVLDSIVVSLNAVGAQAATILVVVRDGATGVGAILWSFRIGGLAAGTSQVVTISGLNIVGSLNTEMTVETTTPPAATNFVSIACTGHLAT